MYLSLSTRTLYNKILNFTLRVLGKENMGVIDSIVVIVFLIFMIIGFAKGFTKQTLSSFAWLFALGAAVASCKIITSMLMQTNVSCDIQSGISNWLEKKCGDSITGIGVTEESLGSTLSILGIPYFLHPVLTKTFDFGNVDSVTMDSFLSSNITSYIFLISSFIIVYLVVFLLIKLFAKVFGDAIKKSPFSFLDRILGLIWGAVKATFIISIAMLLLSLILNLPIQSVNDWIVADMKLGGEDFGVSKYIFEHNPILYIIEQFKNK